MQSIKGKRRLFRTNSTMDNHNSDSEAEESENLIDSSQLYQPQTPIIFRMPSSVVSDKLKQWDKQKAKN